VNLARRLLTLKTTDQLRSTTALVTSITPFTVQLADGAQIAGPKRLSSYTPAVDDVVFVLRPDTGFLVVGDIV
jgi:hypothetical protein